MPYPTFSKAEARVYLQAVRAVALSGEEAPQLPSIHENPEGPDVDWDALADDVVALMNNLISQPSDAKGNVGSAFEIAAGPCLHQAFKEHPALSDPEFWVWFAVSYGQKIIAWRYGELSNLSNFGIGGAGENLFYRIWMRAEIAYTPEDEDAYHLARCGDIDFWRSHIFRQSYGEVRHFARAFVEFQFPAENGGKSRLTISDIRRLAKRLKMARSNLMFEVMSPLRATQFIESEWSRLASETG